MSKFVSLDYRDRDARIREIIAVRKIEKVSVVSGENCIELVEREPNGRVYRLMHFDSQEDCNNQYRKFLDALVEEWAW